MDDVENKIREILFNLGKEIKLLKIDQNNIIINIDYERYVEDLMQCYNLYKEKSNE